MNHLDTLIYLSPPPTNTIIWTTVTTNTVNRVLVVGTIIPPFLPLDLLQASQEKFNQWNSISPKRRPQTRDLNLPLVSGALGFGIVSKIGQPAVFLFGVLHATFATSDKLGDSCCLPLAIPCGFYSLIPLRTKIRTENNIDGSICEDCCMACWCPFCTMSQMSLEQDFVKQNLNTKWKHFINERAALAPSQWIYSIIWSTIHLHTRQ